MSAYVLDRLGRAKWNSLPKVVIEGIVEHMYIDFRRHPPRLSEGVPHFRQPNMKVPSNEMYLYFLMIFSKRLDELALISETWAAVVSEHPFHQEICQIITHRHFPTNSKAAHPTNRDSAKQRCWLCALGLQISDNQSSGKATALPTVAERYHHFANIGSIPVCKDHSYNICQHCLLEEEDFSIDNGGGIDLLEMNDSATYGVFQAQICKACRIEALYRDKIMEGVKLDWQRAAPAWQYVIWGSGSVDEAVEGMLATRWLESNPTFRRLRSEMFGWKQDEAKYNNGKRTKESEDWLDSGGCTELQLREVQKELFHHDAAELVNLGIWILPEFNVKPLTGPDHERSIETHQPGRGLITTTSNFMSWKIGDSNHIPWAGAPISLLKKYALEVEDRIYLAVGGPLIELRNMLVAIEISPGGSAGRRAEQMTEDEVISWLYDPRLYVPDWWAHGHAPISNGSNGKRDKRDDEDLGDDRPRKVRRLDQQQQTAYTTVTVAESDVASDDKERSAPVIEFKEATPRPKDVLEPIEYKHFARYFSKPQINPLWIPTKEHRVSAAIKQIVRECWASVTETIRKCQCGICARRRRQERIEAEGRQKKRKEEKIQKELGAAKLTQMVMALHGLRQAAPPTAAPINEISTLNEPNLDSFTSLDELSDDDEQPEMPSDDVSFDDHLDEEDDTD